MIVRKTWLDVGLALLQDYYQYFLYVLLLAIGGPVLYPRKRQRYIPGVPIIGIEEPGGIKQARENFSTDAKTILIEGYQRACHLQTSSQVFPQLKKEQYKTQNPFYVPSRIGERLMIPMTYVEELNDVPAQEVDFVATFLEVSVR